MRSSALYLSSSCDDSPTSIASFLGGWRSHVAVCWSVLNQRGRKASGYGGLAVARRRGTGQSAARVPMRAAKTRKPPAASGVGSRLPQNSPASIYARTASDQHAQCILAEAQAIARARISWANGNFIFSFLNGYLTASPKVRPLPQPQRTRPPRPSRPLPTVAPCARQAHQPQ